MRIDFKSVAPRISEVFRLPSPQTRGPLSIAAGELYPQLGADLLNQIQFHSADLRARVVPTASIRIRENFLKNNRYDDLCFGVFSLSVERRPSAARGTCVS